jgi:hypothetical protein
MSKKKIKLVVVISLVAFALTLAGVKGDWLQILSGAAILYVLWSKE